MNASALRKAQDRFREDDERLAALQAKIDAITPRVEAAKAREKEGRVKVGLALRFARTLHKTLKVAGERAEEVIGRELGD